MSPLLRSARRRLAYPAFYGACAVAAIVTAAPVSAATLDGSPVTAIDGNTVSFDFSTVTSDQATLACASLAYPPEVDLDAGWTAYENGGPFPTFPVPGYLERLDADMTPTGSKATAHVLPDGDYQFVWACTPTDYSQIRSTGGLDVTLPYTAPVLPGSSDLSLFSS